MRLVLAAITILAATAAVEARGGGSGGGRGGSHYVSGHVTRTGTYVQPHHATNPNSTKLDNWSTKGNMNPYTGQAGTKNPY
jgi:hypothetical protein